QHGQFMHDAEARHPFEDDEIAAIAIFLEMGEPPETTNGLQRRPALRAFLARIFGLNQAYQPITPQGGINQLDIARLKDIERAMRERQQQGPAQRENRNGLWQIGRASRTLRHGLSQENSAVERRRRPLSVAGSLTPQTSKNSMSFLRAPSSSQARSRLMMATSASAASRRLPSAL